MEIVASNSPVQIEARTWLNEHKAESGLSWTEIGRFTDVDKSVLSSFSAARYGGDSDKVAAKVIAYRDRLAVQAELVGDMPQAPEWFETETSKRITSLLSLAQSGKVILVVTTPGIGKTRTAERFAARDPNVWLATMSPSAAGVATMSSEVAAAMGLGDITGSPQQLSRKIRESVASKKGLLIIDEAQELTDKAINEIRGWHDRTGVGVALLGNERVVGQIEGRKSALAQVSSRFFLRHTQMQPLPGDLDALFDAWGITDGEQKNFLAKIGALPGALREMTHTIEMALIAAGVEQQPLSLLLLRRAAKQRNVRIGGL